MLDPTTAPSAARDITPRPAARPSGAAPARGRCRDCRLAPRCLPGALGGGEAQRFEPAVQRCRALAPGEHLHRTGDPFRALHAVESGCFKSYAVDAQGREHVTAFHFPGDLIGIDAIDPGRHASSCVALGTARACVLPYAVLMRLAVGLPALNGAVLRMASRHLVGTTSVAGDFSAEERLAGFLVMVAARLRPDEPPAEELELAMSREDIANHLRLAPETVSRVLARFRKEGLVAADRRRIALLDPAGLGELAACVNPWARRGRGTPAP